MKKLHPVLFLIPAIIFFAAFFYDRHQSGSQAVEVIRVIDGDTFVAKIDGQEKTIRLEGIDAPEIDQAYGQEAKMYLEDLIEGQKFSVSGDEDSDQYDRYIVKALVKGQDVSLSLLRGGYAWFYKAYSTSTEYAAVEAIARHDKKGLWADPNPMPPWEYRNR